MADEVLIAIIAGTAAMIGAAATALATAFSTRHKLKELQLLHLQEKRETYLANARAHVTQIYIPLQAAITRVTLKFEAYQRSTSDESEKETREIAFRVEVERFVEQMNQLLHSGADAFLTTELSEALRSFQAFLVSSLGASEAREKLLLSYNVRLAGLRLGATRREVLKSEVLDKILRTSISMNVAGIGVVA